ncbi:arsenate reductase family protein [Gemmatimonas sp.]|uniref:arsenate reductase family protein n=1 Tax=Gemmatimonas sp. TaxID=1962908 RepID=UPI00391F24D6|nr:arsenate reductase [Gemmatimonadota bacterium]
MTVQIFGSRKSPAVRKAQRFFAERRISVHFVDFAERGMAKGELARFTQKFGVQALVDRQGKRFAELGLSAAVLSDARWEEKLLDEPLLLVQPLVRHQHQLAVGDAEPTWKGWVEAAP